MPQPPHTAALPIGTYIKHVVIVVQENRSFDNLFEGFPGADTATSGLMSNGQTEPLHEDSFSDPQDPGHGLTTGLQAWDNGKMDGFDRALDNVNQPMGKRAYVYIKRTEVTPYWILAKRYVLADRMFPTEWGGSFSAHLDLIAATAKLRPGVVLVDPTAHPWGCDAPTGTVTTTWSARLQLGVGPFPCFTQFATMADTLDAANVSWKFYAPPFSTNSGMLWTTFDAIKNVRYGPDWQTKISAPETNVLTDAANGNLPTVSWVVPDYFWSDHSGSESDAGPSWVAAIVNAIGHGPDWDTTAIVVVWDDWGGWYDNAPPPQLDFAGLAIRVPCIVISPYAKANYVSHTQYEFGSILKFTEQAFRLKSLGYTDARANSIIDSFDFTQKPRAFITIPAKYPPTYFSKSSPSVIPPDSE